MTAPGNKSSEGQRKDSVRGTVMPHPGVGLTPRSIWKVVIRQGFQLNAAGLGQFQTSYCSLSAKQHKRRMMRVSTAASVEVSEAMQAAYFY